MDEKPAVLLRMEDPLFEEIEDFRFRHRFASRAQAIRWLLEWALKQKPDPKRRPAREAAAK
jgi:metal-responsive CopG/Arc/MetJ family transcriptional regulator